MRTPVQVRVWVPVATYVGGAGHCAHRQRHGALLTEYAERFFERNLESNCCRLAAVNWLLTGVIRFQKDCFPS